VDEAGFFHKVPRFNDSRLAEIFAREVLGFLVHAESPTGTGKKPARPSGWIINHLKRTFVADKPPPPQVAFQEYLMAAEASSEYFS
jgi:hypothetical protein